MRQFIDYPKLIEHSMRLVVKKALLCMFENDTELGDHHFYISFLTNSHGVILSDRMRKKYPHQMTIVLQYQFEDLEVKEDYFTVKISFGGVREKVRVPFSAITSFADPSVEFALQFTEIYQDNGFGYPFECDEIREDYEQPKPKKVEIEDLSTLPSNVIQIDKFVKR
jgi:hypothetical protein